MRLVNTLYYLSQITTKALDVVSEFGCITELENVASYHIECLSRRLQLNSRRITIFDRT